MKNNPGTRSLIAVASVFALACERSSLGPDSANNSLVRGSSAEGGDEDDRGRCDGDEGDGERPPRFEPARVEVIAVGIPGAGAICQIGTFHLGGPFHDNPAFAPSTAPGRLLDGRRLLVASSSNFGEPLGRTDQAPGAILSIDPQGPPLAILPDFASAGGQVSAADGRLVLYAANNAAFSNSLFSPAAATAREVSVSLPTGISLNSAFGRPWLANAPTGSAGPGTVSVTDPNGAPFKGPPDPVAGGVFAGDLTNRSAASTHGLSAGTLATALLTKSPDGSGRAVFLAANADGSVVQIHVQKGVDGLAPPGTFTPIPGIDLARTRSIEPGDVSRVGMVFNWVPNLAVFVTDPLANRILVLDLDDDGTLFHATARYLASPWLDRPTDVAPTSVETAARNFASNTTLGGGSDLYVLNRGNNTVVRMTQDGAVIAARRVLAPLPDFRLAGLGVSPDGRTIWLTATLPGDSGAILKMDAFGAGAVTESLLASAAAAGASGDAAQGGHFFGHDFTLEEGLGPLFNQRACVDCHNSPAPAGMGLTGDTFVTRVGRLKHGTFDPLIGHGGPIARQHSIDELGGHCGLRPGVPPQADVTARRSAMSLRGAALIDTILPAAVLAGQAAQPAEVRGRAPALPDGRLGKFGWKADIPTLVEFMAEALRDEVGVTNPLRPQDLVNGCRARRRELDGLPLTSLVAFLDGVDPAVPTAACLSSSGAALFASIGCASCHTPSLPGPGSPTAAQKPVRLYSDLLLHDLGPGLADDIEQGAASGHEFRTAPLWGARDRQHFLHDGRAATLGAAISAHGGQAAAASAAFSALSPADQQALLDFLGCI